MKHYNDGSEVVAALFKNYRETYKRRKNTMMELKGFEESIKLAFSYFGAINYRLN